MPTRPSSSAIEAASNTSRTRPLPLCTRRRVPLPVAMPAASCPRCCSTVRPSYSAAATSVVPTMPMMPHIRVLPGLLGAVGSGMRAHEAVDAEARLHPCLELLGFGAGGDRTGLDAGQAALVGAHRLGEGSDAGAAKAVSQGVGLGGL